MTPKTKTKTTKEAQDGKDDRPAMDKPQLPPRVIELLLEYAQKQKAIQPPTGPAQQEEQSR